MSLSRFLTTDDPLWIQALELCEHDVYHLPAYASLEAGWLKAEAMAFRFDTQRGVMLLPLLVRPTPSGKGLDAVTPYGYSSPVFTHGAHFEFFRINFFHIIFVIFSSYQKTAQIKRRFF